MVPPDRRLGIRGDRPKLRGGAVPKAVPSRVAPTAATAPKRVLFVCIGNAIRSQMAEAFARTYGSDVIVPSSAGLAPANTIPPLTRQILAERNIQIDQQFPKGLDLLPGPFDMVVNLSGFPVPVAAQELLTWPVPDPIGQKEEVYRQAAATIENLVMQLILNLRNRVRAV